MASALAGAEAAGFAAAAAASFLAPFHVPLMSPADQSPASSPLSHLPLIVTAVPPASAAIVILFVSSIVTLVMVNGVGESFTSAVHLPPSRFRIIRKLTVPSSALFAVTLYDPSMGALASLCARDAWARAAAQSSDKPISFNARIFIVNCLLA